MRKIFMALLMIISIGFLALSAVPSTYALTDEEVVLLYVEAPEGWDTPHVWTWNEAGDNAYSVLGWPGKAMLEDENNEGWF